jgi:hypothetical protein
MNGGSKKATVRFGDELFDEIKERVRVLNERPGASREWTFSEFVVQACVEKLRHTQRSCGKQGTYAAEKKGEYRPREFVGDEGAE